MKEHNFYKLAEKVEYPSEEIKKIVEVFSVYLNMSNSDYKYNEPYLGKYTQRFCDILLAIKDKQPLFERLSVHLYVKYNEYFHEKDKIELVIDEFWKCVIINGDIQDTQCAEIDWKKVCSKNTSIKCIYLENAFSKHVYMIENNVFLNNELNLGAVEKIEKELDSFLEKYLVR